MDAQILHELFEYRDGKLFWKIGRSGARKDKPAGFVESNGYARIMIDGKRYGLHKLIFAFHNGFMPEVIDHIDGNKTNNSIENLRAASWSENAWNKKLQKNNTSGVKGVHWHKPKQRWRGMIMKNGKSVHVGMFKTKEDAELAVTKARLELHKEFARHA